MYIRVDHPRLHVDEVFKWLDVKENFRIEHNIDSENNKELNMPDCREDANSCILYLQFEIMIPLRIMYPSLSPPFNVNQASIGLITRIIA